ncbi:MAG TPA: glycosyltransferase family 39 protein [Baekduia sp.]|nr:glycosyltransferase family 39 protein [Baekduia sp.]
MSPASQAAGDARAARPAQRFAARPVLLIALASAALLVVLAGGYGYHRDELYFLVAGHHLAWSFADQGPVTPAIARVMETLAPHSLTVLRLPSAGMSGVTVLMTGLLAFELGGRPRAQVIASACAGVASLVLIVGHLLSTTTFDLMAWALVTWLIARAIRTGTGWLWAVAGAVTGVALLNKPLIAFLVAGLALGVAVVGPRPVWRERWLWAGVAVGLALWMPWLAWQAAHDWPQREVSSAIAAGGSASSQPRWALLPFQLLLVSPLLAPVWIAGLVALARRPRLRPFRLFAVAWAFLVVVFLATGGKPYYLGGLFPVLLAAGAIEADGWLSASARAWRPALLWTAVALSGAVSVVLALPVLPARDAGPVVAMNADVGETIGWPELVATVARVARQAPRRPVVFTSNYGEAGAVDRYGPALGLARAYSGHNAFWDWGPPPDGPTPVVTVGLSASRRGASFTGCRVLARVDNAAGIDNDESGAPVALCSGTREPWSRLWPSLRHLG